MKKVNLFKTVALACGFAIVAFGCKNEGNSVENTETTEAVDSTATQTQNEPEAPALTDAIIASIAVTANKVDVDWAKIAEQKATNPKVKDFAKTMDKDHSNIIDAAVKFATEHNLAPDDNNDTTKGFQSQGKEFSDKLNSLSGAEFDKAYIDNEVTFHDNVIKAVEGTLIPAIQNQEFKDFLTNAVPLFKEHLEHAKMIQEELNK